MYSLAKTAAQIAGPLSRFDSFCSGELPPARHILICGCAAKVKDDFQLVTVALAGKNGLPNKHFSEYTAAQIIRIPDKMISPGKDSPDSPQVYRSGILLQV